jgi:hypothetical protein
MPLPTQDQQRPVISIDLGASYTKVAIRPRWKLDPDSGHPVNPSILQTVPIKIEKDFFVPSVVLDPGDGRDWQCGQDAAGSKPGVKADLIKDWKSTLFDARAKPDDVGRAICAARKFFTWLKSKIDSCGEAKDAFVRICIPEFEKEGSQAGCQRLQDAFRESEWAGSPCMVSEPEANTIGLFSNGRNHVFAQTDCTFEAKQGEIYRNSALLAAARNAAHGARSFSLAIIDVGTFTTDIAITNSNHLADIDVNRQVSFRHGIADLDAELVRIVELQGGDIKKVSYAEFEIVKKIIYGGEPNDWVIGDRSIRLGKDAMKDAITSFASHVVELCAPHLENAQIFFLTGGGCNIQILADRIRDKLTSLGLRCIPEQVDQRLATAIGGASVIFDFADSLQIGSLHRPIEDLISPPIGRPCSCNGANKECSKCNGTGTLPVPEVEPPPTQGRAAHQLGGATSTAEEFSPVEIDNHNNREQSDRTSIDREPPARTNKRATGKTKREASDQIDKPEKPLYASAIIECWRGNENYALREFGLEGWMGQLVFGAGMKSQDSRRKILQDHSSAAGRAAWLRLLCLGACLGVCAKPKYIKSFWENKLPDVWRFLIPADVNQPKDNAYERQLDEIFIKAIHREFNDKRATGEDAELWRRVFYDFRKLHHYVYRNELPRSLLELATQPGLRAASLVHFLKSGFLPGGQKPWVGAIGQSMTAPLLFLLRELGRLGVIVPRFDASCFYMNAPARRVARQLGWITERELALFDIESLIEMSRMCHAKMKVELPEDLHRFFDIPLQWYALQNP